MNQSDTMNSFRSECVIDVESLFSEKEVERLPQNIVAEVVSSSSLPVFKSLFQPQYSPTDWLVFRKTSPRKPEDEDDISEYPLEESTVDLLNSTTATGAPQYLTVQEARAVLSICSMSQRLKIHAEDSPLNFPVWVLCDAQDMDKTYMMGCHHTDGKLVISSITCDGPFERDALPSMAKLKKSISSGNENISSKGYAEYILCNIVSLKSKTDEDGTPLSFVTMGWEWQKVLDLLVAPHGVECSLKIKKGKGGLLNTTPERNARELHILKSFTIALSTEQMYWPPLEHKPPPVTDIVSEYLQDLRDNPVKYVNEKDIPMFEDPEHYEVDILGKRLLDFTERIWLIIAHNATSYEDVDATFDLVEEAFKKGYLQPMIHQDNHSSMANKIREFYYSTEYVNQWQAFSLKHFSSLELVIGIALDKIRRDFTSYLIDENLCLSHHLSWYIPPKDTELSLTEQARRLQSLHHVVELGLLVNGSLKQYISCNLDLMKSVLLHYASSPPDDEYEVVAPSIPEMLKPLCQEDRTIPLRWKVELRSPGRTEQTLTVSLSRNPPFPQIERCVRLDSITEEPPEDEAVSYYMAKLRQHKVRL